MLPARDDHGTDDGGIGTSAYRAAMKKTYDAAYFQRWYRDGGDGNAAIGSRARLARKVAMAVATAEYHLERPLRTVLDIGCGEAVWRAPLLKLRPKAQYLGFDSSEYAVARFGRTRGVHFARFGDFAMLRPCAPVDLLICSDVLHYVPTRELDRGLPGLADLCGGVAFIEMFARGDDADGDDDGYIDRPAAFYRQRLARIGLTQIGSHCWLSPARVAHAAALEVCGGA